MEQIYLQRYRHVSWFYWIAGLSAINSLVAIIGLGFVVIFGLGTTQFLDQNGIWAYQDGFANMSFLFFGLSFLLSGLFALLGYLANKLYVWPVWIGFILFAFDIYPLLLIKDYVSIGFHAYVIFRMIQLINLDRQYSHLYQ